MSHVGAADRRPDRVPSTLQPELFRPRANAVNPHPPTRTSHPEGRAERFDLRALYETSRLLSASLDIGFVLKSLLLSAMSKALTTRGMVLLCDPVEGAYRVASACGPGCLPPEARLEMDLVPGEHVVRGEAVPEALATCGITLLLPIAHSHRAIGWLGLGSKATGAPFTGAELEFLRSLVHMSSAAVHNALLVEELQQANRDLDAKVQELNTLFDLSQEFGTTVDSARLGKLLSFALMGQMMVRRHLFLLRRSGDAADDPLRVVTARGLDAGTLTPDVLADLQCADALVQLDEEGADLSPAQHVLREAGFRLLLPIRHQGATCALLGLGPKGTGEPYAPGDIEFLYALGNLAYTSVQNAYLVEEQIEKRRLEEEMRLARQIQQRLLPRQIPAAADLEVAARATPSREVGGDYFDVIPLSGERLLLVIADVTGKGVPAALLMANVQACTHTLVPSEITLEEATRRINQVVCQNTGADKFITFFHAIYHPGTRRFDYVNAGHNPPLVVRTGGAVEELSVGGLLLGVMENAPYTRGSVTLHPGDVLTLFTDGVTEAMNAATETYGEARLTERLRAHRTEAAPAILDAVHDDVRAFAGRAPQSDDLTLIVSKVSGA